MSDFLAHIKNLLPMEEVKNFINCCQMQHRKSIRFFSRTKEYKKKIGYQDDYYKIEEKVLWTSDGFYLSQNSRPSKSLDYLRGDFYIQDASSMYPVASLKDYLKSKCGNSLSINYILDYAASPGGKTTQLADYFPLSIIIANEVIKGRINAIYSNLIRSKLKNIILLNKDFYFFQNLNLKFDIILADLPCSGESLIYKNKVSFYDWSLKEVLFNAKRQKKISGDLLNILNENGYFLYSTCTFSKEENEDIVQFLVENNLKLIEQKRLWPHRDNCAGGFSALLKNVNSPDLSKFEDNKLKYIENQNDKLLKILSKNSFFDTDKIIKNGYLYLKDQIIYLFSFPEILKNLFENAKYIGIEIAKIEKYGVVPLWGSIDYAKQDFNIKLDKDILYKLLKGTDIKNLKLNLKSKYFVASDEESQLFLLKNSENGIKNLIPNFMIVK